MLKTRLNQNSIVKSPVPKAKSSLVPVSILKKLPLELDEEFPKKVRDKELQPTMTEFMVKYNVSDLKILVPASL